MLLTVYPISEPVLLKDCFSQERRGKERNLLCGSDWLNVDLLASCENKQNPLFLSLRWPNMKWNGFVLRCVSTQTMGWGCEGSEMAALRQPAGMLPFCFSLFLSRGISVTSVLLPVRIHKFIQTHHLDVNSHSHSTLSLCSCELCVLNVTYECAHNAWEPTGRPRRTDPSGSQHYGIRSV